MLVYQRVSLPPARPNPVARGSGIRGSSPHLTVPSDRCGGLGLHRLRCNLESPTMNESCLKKCPILSMLYHFIHLLSWTYLNYLKISFSITVTRWCVPVFVAAAPYQESSRRQILSPTQPVPPARDWGTANSKRPGTAWETPSLVVRIVFFPWPWAPKNPVVYNGLHVWWCSSFKWPQLAPPQNWRGNLREMKRFGGLMAECMVSGSFSSNQYTKLSIVICWL